MWELTENEFRDIVRKLSKLEKHENASERGKSWMTASELLSAIGKDWTRENAKVLDEALREIYRKDDECKIRPAYYPGEDTCERLWGHVDNVPKGPAREELLETLAKHPLVLEPVEFAENAPCVFISHALVDHHFAARVRLALARCGVRSWVAEGELYGENNLFEGVEAALSRCDAIVVLITSASISSAWIDTEVKTALKKDKTVVALVDASDAPVCALLKKLLPRNTSKWRDDLLDKWLKEEGIEVTTSVLQRFMQCGSASRILKFHTSLKLALESMTFRGKVAFFPELPEEYPAETATLSFIDVANELGIKNIENADGCLGAWTPD